MLPLANERHCEDPGIVGSAASFETMNSVKLIILGRRALIALADPRLHDLPA
jgi:hypothetical protein